MTTVSFVAQLTAVSNWLTSGHQICCWASCGSRSISYCMEMTRGINKTGHPHITIMIWGPILTTLLDRWTGPRGSVEHPPRSPRLNPPDFFLWGYLKDAVYSTKPATLRELQQEIERSCPAILAANLVAACEPVAHRCQLCHEADGGHFEHLY
jgi:hypothetical protein